MKLARSLVVAVLVAAPALSFAQSNQSDQPYQANRSLTRADVRAELVDLQKAGYNPLTDQTQYPQNIQAAEARVSAQKGLARSSYGPSPAGTSALGARASESDASNGIGVGAIYAKP